MSRQFLDELYGYLESEPGNITVRQLILELWDEFGDHGSYPATA